MDTIHLCITAFIFYAIINGIYKLIAMWILTHNNASPDVINEIMKEDTAASTRGREDSST
jgi:hypothetical protein